MGIEWTPTQLAVLRKLDDSDLAILAELDLSERRQERKEACARVLFRVHYNGGASARARAIVRDTQRVQRGEKTGDSNKDKVLAKFAALCGDRIPAYNTIIRYCQDIPAPKPPPL